MKENMYTNENNFTESIASPANERDVLSLTEQRQLIRGSYCHQYGTLIRLMLQAGLRVPELLGLQWDDLDIDHCCLRIRHQYLYCSESGGFRIISITPHDVPVPAALLKELAELRDEQRNTLAMYNLPAQCNSVATTLKGHQMPDWILDYYFKQILRFCGLPNYSLGILRETFAANAIVQGMDMETLSGILGEPNVRHFYAKYKPRRKNTVAGQYNAELNEQLLCGMGIAYPIVVKSLPDGLIQLSAPNFPELTCTGPILAHELIIMRDRIEDKIRYSVSCPTPVSVTDISCEADECIIQMCVNV